MLKNLIKSVFFFTILMIIAMPTFMAFYGPALHHHHNHIANRHKAGHTYLETGGHHDTSWELIKKRHLSAPPTLIKVRMLAAVCLLFSIFAFAVSSAVSNLSFANYLSRKKPFPIAERYLVYQTFLI